MRKFNYCHEQQKRGRVMDGLNQATLVSIARRAFLLAMQAGYASGKDTRRKVQDFPSGKLVVHTFTKADGDLAGVSVHDQWFTHGAWSAGSTLIFRNEIPLWKMDYGGFYQEIVIPFLKAALSDSYSLLSFTGGRGPYWFTKKDFAYLYLNKWDGDFCEFRGQEEILNQSVGYRYGYHRYSGLWLAHEVP